MLLCPRASPAQATNIRATTSPAITSSPGRTPTMPPRRLARASI